MGPINKLAGTMPRFETLFKELHNCMEKNIQLKFYSINSDELQYTCFLFASYLHRSSNLIIQTKSDVP
jgi:hypothetical protein